MKQYSTPMSGDWAQRTDSSADETRGGFGAAGGTQGRAR
jgi:hypothetical protein